jgi:carboxyl-terminal processing protease
MNASRQVVLALTCGAVLGFAFPFAERALGVEAVVPLPLDELHSFSQALDIVGSRYVDEVPADKLMENALRGMIDGLEPHSHYLDKSEYADWNVTTSGKYAGVGIEVEAGEGFLRVVTAMDHTPAAAAGIQSGDLITQIDGHSTAGIQLKDAVDRMRGAQGSKVRLSLMRAGSTKVTELVLTRDLVKVASVRSKMLESGIGYLRIINFAVDTGDSFNEELAKLQKQSGGLNGLILDLRNNPGGVVNAAVEVSDALLEQGTIVVQRGRAPGANHEYDATPGDLLKGRPLVAMVNGGTASAAEIVAGALQDHRRAVLVGTGTFGKGLVQNVTPLPNGGAMVLTIARYYTPSGRSIQAEGIRPDVVVDPVKVSAAQAPATVREADLQGSLPNQEPAKPEATETGIAEPGAPDTLAESDYVLYNSLNVLKGMIIAGAVAPAG